MIFFVSARAWLITLSFYAAYGNIDDNRAYDILVVLVMDEPVNNDETDFFSHPVALLF